MLLSASLTKPSNRLIQNNEINKNIYIYIYQQVSLLKTNSLYNGYIQSTAIFNYL